MWLSVWRQRPGVLGESFGRAVPSTSATGLENVMRIGVAGVSTAPGAGLLTATGKRAGGNQLTATGAPSRSQGRGAAATSTVPAAALIPSATERRTPPVSRRTRWPPVPEATALTGRSNLTRTTDPDGTVSQRSLT